MSTTATTRGRRGTCSTIQRTTGLSTNAISQARKKIRMTSPKAKKTWPTIPITTIPRPIVARMSRMSMRRACRRDRGISVWGAGAGGVTVIAGAGPSIRAVPLVGAGVGHRRPIRSRTSAIVASALGRRRSAPAARISSIRSGSAISSA